MKKLSLDISFNLNNFVNNFLISILTPVKYLLTPIEIENIKGNNIYLFLFAYFLSLFISIKISNKYKIKKNSKNKFIINLHNNFFHFICFIILTFIPSSYFTKTFLFTSLYFNCCFGFNFR